MHWKFWEKNKTQNAVKLPKPTDLPSGVGRDLVVVLNYDPDWVWQLKSVAKKKENTRDVFDFRIFDPLNASLRGITVLNHTSLDEHPDQIYFDGWYNKETWEIKINDRYKSLKKGHAA